MTYAPQTLLDARAYLKGRDADLSDAETGIVGGPSHVQQGTSYHLGADQLIMSKNPYSARTSRDKAGLSNAASALDIDDDLDELRLLSVWIVDQCRRSAPDTLDIREIIFSPDGINVYRWDRERGVTSDPIPDGDLSHRTHSHVSYYRDSEFRDKVNLYRRFFEEVNMGTISEEVWGTSFVNPSNPNQTDLASTHLIYANKNSFEANVKADQILAEVQELSAPVVDIPALAAELLPLLLSGMTPVVRQLVRDELDSTKLSGPSA